MFGHTIIGGKEVLTFNGEPLERDTRSLSQIIEDFKGSAGKFEEFQSGVVTNFTKKRIEELFHSYNYPLNAKEIYSRLNLSRTSFHRVVDEMKKEGKIYTAGTARNIVYFNQKIDKISEKTVPETTAPDTISY